MTVAVAIAAVVMILGLTLVRLLIGPTLYDRMIAANAMIIQVALICAAVSVLHRATAFVDVSIALVFSLLVANVAALKFFSARTFQAPLDLGAEDSPR